MRLSFRRVLLTLSFFVSVAVFAGVAARPAGTVQEGPAAAICILPDDMAWSRDARVHGLETAVLFGNPSAPEPYVQRIKFPANYRLPPHWHPNDGRMVTVLSGTLYFAFGDKFDESKLRALPAGTFFVEPKDTPHFALTKGEVVLQLNAVGPTGTRCVMDTSEVLQHAR
jgi:quercetin dioxygenase-like cupin family protein